MSVADPPGPLDVPGRVLGNAVVRSAGEVLAKIASLVFFVTMARELGSTGFGVFMFALGLTSAVVLPAGFGTDELTGRTVSRARDAAARLVSDVGSLKTVTAALLLGLAVLVTAVRGFGPDTVVTVCLVGIGVAVEAVTRTWFAVFQAYERLSLVALSIVVERFSTAVVGIVALAAGAGVRTAAAIFVGGALVGFVTAELSLRRIVADRPRPRPSHWFGLMRAGLPFGMASLLFVLLPRLDVTLLSFLAGEQQVGFYSAGSRLVESSQLLTWGMAAAMLPWLARGDGGAARTARGVELALKAITAVLVPIGVTFVVLAGPLVHLLYGPEFEPSVLPLQLLGVTSVFYGVQGLSVTVCVARNVPGVFTRLVSVVVVLDVAVNAVLIPRYGAPGAAATAVLAGLLLAGGCLVQLRRHVGAVRVLRSLSGPVVAGCVTAGVGVLVRSPVAGIAAGLLAYLVVLAAIELLAFRADVRVYRDAVVALLRRARLRPARREPPGSQSDR